MITALALAAATQNTGCTSDPVMTHVVAAHVPLNDTAQLRGGRVTMVQLTINAQGKVTGAKVYRTSGLPDADAAAIAAARASTYKPAMQNCQPTAQTVVFDEVVRPDYAALAKSCPVRYQDATVLEQAAPMYPDSARRLHAGGQAAVEVTIGPNGELESARIVSTAENMALDQAALYAARQSIYAPKIVNCMPTTGQYLFKVTFNPNLPPV